MIHDSTLETFENGKEITDRKQLILYGPNTLGEETGDWRVSPHVEEIHLHIWNRAAGFGECLQSEAFLFGCATGEWMRMDSYIRILNYPQGKLAGR